jgi:predicted ArsR family transcriptional regulator
MGETIYAGELTSAERHLIALLRQGPQSVDGLAEALCTPPEQIRAVLESLHRKVGLVRLFRSDTLRYGLAE